MIGLALAAWISGQAVEAAQAAPEVRPVPIRSFASPVADFGGLRTVDVVFICNYQPDGRSDCTVGPAPGEAVLIDRAGEWMAAYSEHRPDLGAVGAQRTLTLRFKPEVRPEIVNVRWAYWTTAVEKPVWRTSPEDLDQALFYAIAAEHGGLPARREDEVVHLACPVMVDGWLGLCRSGEEAEETTGAALNIGRLLAANVRMAELDGDGVATGGRHIRLSFTIRRPEVIPDVEVVPPVVISTPNQDEVASLTPDYVFDAGMRNTSEVYCISPAEIGPPSHCLVGRNTSGRFAFSRVALEISRRRLLAPGLVNGQPYRAPVANRVTW